MIDFMSGNQVTHFLFPLMLKTISNEIYEIS